jgi:GAF domain-containing protein
MTAALAVADLLTPLATAASLEAGLDLTLRRLVRVTGAGAGALGFRPPRGAPLVVVAGGAGAPADALRGLVSAPPGSARRLLAALGAGRRVVRRLPLGPRGRPVGALALLGRPGARGHVELPGGLARELGTALRQAWQARQRADRLAAHHGMTRLLVSGETIDEVLVAFAEGLDRLLAFDTLGLARLDPERPEFEVSDVLMRPVPRVVPREGRRSLARTVLAQMVAIQAPVRVDDLDGPAVPGESRRALFARGLRSVLLVPLTSDGGVFGAVVVGARRRAAFDDADVELVVDLARPLAAALEHRRLLDESRRRTEELAALYSTSQLITARLDAASVLDRISRSVTALIGSSGCGIGLLEPGGLRLVHAAAHGFKSDEWRALALPVGEGIIGRCAESGVAIRVDDVRGDPRSARRDVDEREGIRSMLCVPLRGAGALLGVISAFSTRPAAFSAHHQRVLEAFAEQAGIAVQNARLFEESLKRTRETRALFEAGRTVTASLDPQRTVRVIMEQARAVLGVASCGIMTLDPATRELTLVASLDLPEEVVRTVRIAYGEGIAGRAARDLRPRQSADLANDPRVRFRELPRQSGLRAAMAAPLRVGDHAIGVIEVFHREVHQFTAAEEELLVALADQAAIALEHARLYEGLETIRSASSRWCWKRCRSACSCSTPPCASSGPIARGRARSAATRRSAPPSPGWWRRNGRSRWRPSSGAPSRAARSPARKRRWPWPVSGSASASRLPRCRAATTARTWSCWSRTSRWPSSSSGRCCSPSV